jgi:hypothetical protein
VHRGGGHAGGVKMQMISAAGRAALGAISPAQPLETRTSFGDRADPAAVASRRICYINTQW